MYAKQLDISFPIPEDRDRQILSEHGKLKISNRPSLIRRNLLEVDDYLNLLPQVRDFCIDSSISDLKLLSPHLHTKDKSVINFYLSTNNEVTSFWEGKDEFDDRWTTDGGGTYYNVKPENLDVVYRFCAKPGDVWILNPQKIHSVLPDIEAEENIKKGNKDRRLIHYVRKNTRKMIQLIFNIEIDEMIERIYGTKL